jgi:CheY-like chemotaxis protein
MRTVVITKGEDVVPNLQKAFEADDPFDLCISDIQMPGMDGYGVAKQIRKFKNSIGSIPLLALSSMMERDAKKCEAVGFDGFLSKPVRKEKLFRIMEKIIGKKPGGREQRVGGEEKRIVTQYSVKEEMKHSVRILLAEDNPVNQKLVKLMLTKAGYYVDVASNGKIALNKYRESPDNFDLIFMDIQMPEMDGLEAAREIRGFETKNFSEYRRARITNKGKTEKHNRSTMRSVNHVPIIAMTANAMKGDMEKCLNAGMDDYMTKPIKRDLVFEMVKKWAFIE